MQRQPFAENEMRPRQQPAHRFQVVLGQLAAQHGRQQAVCGSVVRVRAQGRAEASLRLVEGAEFFQDVAQIRVADGEFRFETYDLAVLLDGLIVLVLFVQHEAQPVVRLRTVRLQLQREVVMRQSVRIVLLFLEGAGEMAMGAHGGRVTLKRLPIPRHRLDQLALFLKSLTHVAVRQRESRIEPQRFGVTGFRVRQLPLLAQHISQIVLRFGESGS